MDWVETLMSAGSRQTLAATLPPDCYSCLLDEPPLHLIPQPASRALQVQVDSSDLFLNPGCVLTPATELPKELSDRPDLVSGFVLQGTIAWVQDAVTASQLPFWLGPKMEGIVRSLSIDQPASSTLRQETRALLLAAGILRHKEKDPHRLRQREEAMGKAATLFRENGYAPLADLIHPFHVAALRRYYRRLIRTGQIRLGDRQSPRRYAAYNDPVARFFHHQIAKTLSLVAGESLRPSYVYAASYLSGAELEKHIDRAQCEFSVTLCLDFSPEPALATPWPIHLDTRRGTVTVYQALGDGLAYRGTRLPHFRDALAEGQTSTSIFFHYVGEAFTDSLD